MATSDSLLICEGRPGAQSDHRPWLGQRYIPEHPGVRTAPNKLRVIDPVAQHDEKTDEQLARHGDLGRGGRPVPEVCGFLRPIQCRCPNHLIVSDNAAVCQKYSDVAVMITVEVTGGGVE